MATPKKKSVGGYVALIDFKDKAQYGKVSYKAGDEITWTDQVRLDAAIDKGVIAKGDKAGEPDTEEI